MKTTITKATNDNVKTLLTIISIWGGFSLIYSPIVLPGPLTTLASTIDVVSSKSFLVEVFITLKRLAIGLMAAITLGSVLGIVIGAHSKARGLFNPVFHILQATPPISWLVLAMVWFGLDGEATVFIVFMASLPIMIINILDGFEKIDERLIEMGKSFNVNDVEIYLNIVLPSLKTYFKSGITVIVGLGWKIVIMGEVLSSSTGIGAQITNARLNIDTSRVLAWTIVVILLAYFMQVFIDCLFLVSYRLKKN